MDKLSNNQKRFLRSRGYMLKPVVMVGQHGLSEAISAELKSTMQKHELLKIKIRTEHKDDKQKIMNEILNITKAHLIQVIGNIMVIYRAFDNNPKIILPRK